MWKMQLAWGDADAVSFQGDNVGSLCFDSNLQIDESDAEPDLGTTFLWDTASSGLAISLQSLLPETLFLPTFAGPSSSSIRI